jgi:hypothetical protein
MIFNDLGVQKTDLAKGIYRQHLHASLGLSPGEQAFVFDQIGRQPEWFREVTQYPQFEYLDPIKLASTVDYVLRDSHYSGRYMGGFDLRYFMSVFGNDNETGVLESLFELHRAVHSLNDVYGDPSRRALTAVLHRLTSRLIGSGHLPTAPLIDPIAQIELDDDAFLEMLESAARASEDHLAQGMFSVIFSRSTPSLISYAVDEVPGGIDRGEASGLVEARLANSCSLDPDAVFVTGEYLDDGLGFRLFGREFKNLGEAVRDERFAACTGLSSETVAASAAREHRIHVLVLRA